MIGCLRLVLVMLLSAQSWAQNGTYVSKEKLLYRHLMNDYLPAIRPVDNENETVNVLFNFHIKSFDNLDEKNQEIALSGYVYQSWKDAGLTWDTSDYGGVRILPIRASELWIPDILPLHSKDSNYAIPKEHNALVNSRGTVRWVAPVNIVNMCKMDLTYFPFDEHTCNIVFLSWSFDASKVNVSLFRDPAEDEVSIYLRTSVAEWDITSVKLKRNEYFYRGINTSFQDVTYYIKVKRQSTFSTHLFVGPSITLCLLTPIVFLLPPGTVEKMMLGIGLLLSNLLLMLQLIDFIPTAHHSIPYVARYLVGNIVMTSISLILSAAIVGCWNKSNTRATPPPAFLRLFIQRPVSTVFCVSKDNFVEMEEVESSSESSSNPHKQEGGTNPASELSMEQKQRQINTHLRAEARAGWRQLAVVFDRFFFVVYAILLAVLTLAFAQYL